MKIALICGEASGDDLGAGLARALQAQNPKARLVGVTGPKMRDAGVGSFLDCSRFSVMGYLHAMARLPSLLSARNRVIKKLRVERPEVMVGIDAPDLNMGIGRTAREIGIKYVQYVCPSFWAWRHGRARFLAQHCDLVLSLLPFEKALCERENIKCEFVGHRLASEIKQKKSAKADAKKILGLDAGSKVLALLPGSRPQELSAHAKLFADTASICAARTRKLLVCWAPSKGLEHNLPVIDGAMVFAGKAREVMAAADAALVKSGTITLEAALLFCPQVIAYTLGPIAGLFAKPRIRHVHDRHYGLPNLLAEKKVVPEFIQDRAKAEDIASALVPLLEGKGVDEMQASYKKIRAAIEVDSDKKAAQAVLGLLA